jgi:pyrroline-5-carboxylate reductase
MKVLIIGSGNMGKTYARSFLASRFIQARDLYILDKSREQAASVTEIPDANIYLEAGTFIGLCDIIILAVKPQDFPGLAQQVKGFINPGQLVLSIMAGIKMKTISELLGVEKVVRSMPNLPAQVGMGMTVFTSAPDIDKKELFITQNLINTTGKSIYVEDEGMLDAATAVSGSGPAYVYYFMDAMINAAIRMGFTQSQAELLVNQTFMGAVHLHNQSELTCADWIARVASKGGTTEAAIKVFNSHALSNNIQSGLDAALNRAKELGK